MASTTGTWKRPQFYLTMLAALVAIAPNILVATGECDAVTWALRVAGLLGAGLVAVGYSLARGMVKAHALPKDAKPVFGTTEFWMALAVAIGAAVPLVFGGECAIDDQIIKWVEGGVALAAAVGWRVARALEGGPG